MPDLTLLLIAGRSLKQGTGLNMGKDSAEYTEAVTTVELSQPDMARLGVGDGDEVQLSTSDGETNVRCRRGDLPEGMGFIAYGPASSTLMGTATHASGMPASKAIEVTVRAAPARRP